MNEKKRTERNESIVQQNVRRRRNVETDMKMSERIVKHVQRICEVNVNQRYEYAETEK